MGQGTGSRPKHFEWARHKTRGELLDLVLDVEERLREWIRSVLAVNSTSQAHFESLVLESVASPLRKSQSPHLESLTLGQLVDLVLHRWAWFERSSEEKGAFRQLANEFREWRNRLAHAHVPTGEEKVRISMLVHEMRRHVPLPADEPGIKADTQGAVVLWVDDQPQGNHRERRILRALGIRVLPVRSNDEALAVARDAEMDLVISDIRREGSESGLELPDRLRAEGTTAPIIFYVGRVAPEISIPPHAHSIHDDPARLLLAALQVLTQRRSRASD